MPINSTGSTPSTGVTTEASSPAAVDIARTPWMRPLALDYVSQFAAVASFFSGNPADAFAWREAIARSQAHHTQHDDLVAVLRAQQQRRGAPTRAMDAVQQLADPHTVAIVTGQQAGLFGGPLYTLLKALTAIKLAERVSREHQVSTVAV